jgi:hypothetical protein
VSERLRMQFDRGQKLKKINDRIVCAAAHNGGCTL